MNPRSTGYLRTMKAALTGDQDAPLVFVCNFEAEAEWGRGHTGLPGLPAAPLPPVVQRMEELGALLAGPGDVLLLKQPLDEDYRRYAAGLGIALPTVAVPENTRADRTTTADALDSPRLMARLRGLAEAGARLMPMGTTVLEEKLASDCGLPLAVPDTATFERVNPKSYSRRITQEAGLRVVPGAVCETVGDLARMLHGCRLMIAGGLRVVVKDSYGVSGKGMIVLDTPQKIDRLIRMAERRAQRTGDDRLEVVAEQWLDKRCDLNYQFTVDTRGRVRLDFVKELLTEHGVHKGHLSPAGLDPGQHAEIEAAAHAVGARLHADGFHGVAACDAIVGADGAVYPVLEINARLNMSSYQGGVTELFQPPGHVALARHYPLRLHRPVTFGEVRAALDGIALDGIALDGAALDGTAPDGIALDGAALDGTALDGAQAGPGQIVVTCFGTVNAASGGRTPFEGRLYTVLVAPGRGRLAELDAAAEAALSRLTGPGQPGPASHDRASHDRASQDQEK
jgi:Pre ATP-grasp domain/Carbamoyl-phosphate synthase L chain, ATP binding domain